MHGTSANTSPYRRRAIISHYMPLGFRYTGPPAERPAMHVVRETGGRGRLAVSAALAVNIAMAGLKTRASSRDNRRATLPPYGVTK